jgi:hypothetical protein
VSGGLVEEFEVFAGLFEGEGAFGLHEVAVGVEVDVGAAGVEDEDEVLEGDGFAVEGAVGGGGGHKAEGLNVVVGLWRGGGEVEGVDGVGVGIGGGEAEEDFPDAGFVGEGDEDVGFAGVRDAGLTGDGPDFEGIVGFAGSVVGEGVIGAAVDVAGDEEAVEADTVFDGAVAIAAVGEVGEEAVDLDDVFVGVEGVVGGADFGTLLVEEVEGVGVGGQEGGGGCQESDGKDERAQLHCEFLGEKWCRIIARNRRPMEIGSARRISSSKSVSVEAISCAGSKAIRRGPEFPEEMQRSRLFPFWDQIWSRLLG